MAAFSAFSWCQPGLVVYFKPWRRFAQIARTSSQRSSIKREGLFINASASALVLALAVADGPGCAGAGDAHASSGVLLPPARCRWIPGAAGMPSSQPIKTHGRIPALEACRVDRRTASTSPLRGLPAWVIKVMVWVSSIRFLASRSPFSPSQRISSCTFFHLLSAGRGSSLSNSQASANARHQLDNQGPGCLRLARCW